MATRMRHGPRFGTPIVSTKPVVFDENSEDRRARRDLKQMLAIMDKQPQYRKELRYWKSKQGLIARNAPRRQRKAAREQAEERMAEAIHQAVATLEFAMTELMQHPAPAAANYNKHVNQATTINAIVTLKTKCGVYFPPGDFMLKVEIDPAAVHPDARPPEQVKADEDFHALTVEVQRKARQQQEARFKRLEAMRAAAKRLADRKARDQELARLTDLALKYRREEKET